MNAGKLIMASVAIRGVYRRLAGLSEEDKQKVVEMVKNNLKEKYPDSVQDDGTAQVSDSEEGQETEEKPEEQEKAVSPTKEEPKGEEDSVLEDTDDDDDIVITPAEDNSEGAKITDKQEEKPAVAEKPEEPAATEEKPVEKPAVAEKSAEKPAAVEEKDEKPSEVGGEKEATADDSLDVNTQPKSEDEQSQVEEIADDIEKDVEQIKSEGNVSDAQVLGLFGDMMKMVNLLVHTRIPRKTSRAGLNRIASRIAESVIAERIVVSSRGLQLKRKDTDMMSDTGGSSKHPSREPDTRGPRNDVRKPFRTKNKPAETRDPDTESAIEKDVDMRNN